MGTSRKQGEQDSQWTTSNVFYLAKYTRIGLIAIIIVVGAVYRLWLLTSDHPCRGDGLTRYNPLALRLMNCGTVFDDELPYDVPGYPLLLAAVYSVFGCSPESMLVAQPLIAVQLCIEFLTLVLLTMILSELGYPFAVRLVALSLGWLFPTLATQATCVYADSLCICLLTWFFLMCLIAHRRQSNACWFRAGLVGGLATMFRVDVYPILIIVPFYLVGISSHHTKWKVLRLCSYCGACLLAVLPWIVTIYSVYGLLNFPGQQQFLGNHLSSGYRQWLDTWAYDPAILDPLVFRHPSESQSKTILEDQPLLEEGEKSRAYELLRLMNNPDQGNGEIVNEGFAQMAEQARAKRPIWKWVFVPALRVMFAVRSVPSLAICPFGSSPMSKWVLYGFWAALLAFASVGWIDILRHHRAAAVAFILFGLCRFVMPLMTFFAIEPRYQFPIIPLVCGLAGVGLATFWFWCFDQPVKQIPAEAS